MPPNGSRLRQTPGTGEAEKILKVKQAEAEAESKAALQGTKGIANQRKAIIEGLKQSVEAFFGRRGRNHSQRCDDAGTGDSVLGHDERNWRLRPKQHYFCFALAGGGGDLFRQMQEAVMIGQKGAAVSQ